MYKHSTYALPQYLRSIIPETVSSKTSYGLSNQHDINAPRSIKKLSSEVIHPIIYRLLELSRP